MNNIRFLLWLFGFAIFPWNQAQGNPLAIDGERRPIKMTSEQVMVQVRPMRSLVFGTYTFQQEPDNWPMQEDKYVLIYLPIILSEKDANSYSKQCQSPKVCVGSHAFVAKPVKEPGMVGHPEPVDLPKGWVIQLYQAKILLSIIKPQFTVSVAYVQPNFPGEVTAYIPFFPPHEAELATVSFMPPQGYGLAKVGLFSFLSDTKPRLDFRPLDRKLIAVRLKRNKSK